jgi:glycosidase
VENGVWILDSEVTGDYIFGTLGTDERRLGHEVARLRGVWHGSRTSPIDPVPGDEVTFTVTVGTDVSAGRVELLLTHDGSLPDDKAPVTPLTRRTTEWSTIGWGYVEIWTCTIRADSGGMWRYRVRAVTPNGEVVWADVNPRTGEPGSFALSIDTERNAAWLKKAVIYQVMVDRFAASDTDTFAEQPTLMDIWGGTLQGLIRHLDHIKKLGANALWLTPIFPSPTHHGYDVTDYTAIEPRLGTMADFDELVAKAHGLGMRIILDLVASHASSEHPLFQEALADPDSPYRDLFLIDREGGYDTFFGVRSMPRINGDNDAALQWLVEAGAFWIERGVDGFRLDYAIGQSQQFWTRFRREMRTLKPDFALIAEAVDSPETLRQYQGRIDAVLDFTFLEQVRLFIGFEKETAADFWRFYQRAEKWFDEGPITVSFLDNHDMNRFLWIVGGDTRRLKIAALLQLSLPSPAVVYYGTEVGLNQWRDLTYPDGTRRMEESRTPMMWGSSQDKDLLGYYRSLVFWREKFDIARGRPQLVHAGDDGMLIFTTDSWLIAINRSDEEVGIDLGSYGSMWLSLATGNDVKLYGSELVLPAYSGAILANELAR